jgi:hypothetical protein
MLLRSQSHDNYNPAQLLLCKLRFVHQQRMPMVDVRGLDIGRASDIQRMQLNRQRLRTRAMHLRFELIAMRGADHDYNGASRLLLPVFMLLS